MNIETAEQEEKAKDHCLRGDRKGFELFKVSYYNGYGDGDNTLERRVCRDCRSQLFGVMGAAFKSPGNTPQSFSPTPIGIWDQPIDGLLYDLDLMPEQLAAQAEPWKKPLMAFAEMLTGMHRHLETIKAYANAEETKTKAWKELAVVLNETTMPPLNSTAFNKIEDARAKLTDLGELP